MLKGISQLAHAPPLLFILTVWQRITACFRQMTSARTVGIRRSEGEGRFRDFREVDPFGSLHFILRGRVRLVLVECGSALVSNPVLK